MTTYKGTIPEITIALKRGDVKKMKLSGSKDAEEAFRFFFSRDTIELYEETMVIYLNRQNISIGWFKVSQGGMTGTVVDTRLIFATALKVAAASMILCHNHPSGNKQPSEADIKVTKQIKQIGEFHDIMLLDHLILTEKEYLSMADEGIF